MSTIRVVTDQDVPAEDQAQLLACLKQWKAEGQANPLIPCGLDADGDGTTDAFGLGPFGDLVLVSRVDIADTTVVSDGTGFETPDEDGVDNG